MEQFEITFVLPAPVKMVYDTWVSPDTIIPPAVRVEIDPVVGGIIRFKTVITGVGSEVIGKFSIVIPYQKLAFTWEWNNDQQVSLVSVIFKELEDNQTEMTLTHSGFANDESATLHYDGWTRYIEGFSDLIKEKNKK